MVKFKKNLKFLNYSYFIIKNSNVIKNVLLIESKKKIHIYIYSIYHIVFLLVILIDL